MTTLQELAKEPHTLAQRDTEDLLGTLIVDGVGLPILEREIIFLCNLEEAILEKENPFVTPSLKDSYLI